MATALAAAIVLPGQALAENYIIDTKGAHAFIQFRIQHLGYSWLSGRFNTFTGKFSYDEKNPGAAKIEVDIDPASIDSNHAERDKHLRNEDFLTVDKFGTATFKSTKYTGTAEEGTLEGELTLMGVTKPIAIKVKKLGEGKDPWGGYRRGFEGTTRFALADYGVDYNLGPASKDVELYLSIEGIRK